MKLLSLAVVLGLVLILFITMACAKDNSARASGGQGLGPTRAALPAADGARVTLSEEEWRARLTREEYRVLREQGTERAFSGDLWDHHDGGIYVCAGCGLPLFDSATKFDSGTGWPSFYAPQSPEAVATTVDSAFGMTRTEVHCARCDGHLGHVFPDGPPPTGLRHCINSVSLDFVAAGAPKDPAAGEAAPVGDSATPTGTPNAAETPTAP